MRDTKITFYLQEDQSEFSEERRLKVWRRLFLNSSASPLNCPWRNRPFREEDEEENEEEGWAGSRRPVSLSPCRKTPRCTRGGQARHEVHFRLEGGTVRVLGGMTLDGSGKETLIIIGFHIVLHVEKSKEKAVTDSGEDEQDNRGGR